MSIQRHFATGAICIIKIGRIHASYETIKTRKGAETEFSGNKRGELGSPTKHSKGLEEVPADRAKASDDLFSLGVLSFQEGKGRHKQRTRKLVGSTSMPTTKPIRALEENAHGLLLRLLRSWLLFGLRGLGRIVKIQQAFISPTIVIFSLFPHGFSEHVLSDAFACCCGYRSEKIGKRMGIFSLSLLLVLLRI